MARSCSPSATASSARGRGCTPAASIRSIACTARMRSDASTIARATSAPSAATAYPTRIAHSRPCRIGLGGRETQLAACRDHLQQRADVSPADCPGLLYVATRVDEPAEDEFIV